MIINKKDIHETLSLIKSYLQSSKYVAINESNNVSQYHIEQRFDIAFNRLDNYELDSIPIDCLYSPSKLKSHWIDFDKNFKGEVTQKQKLEYGILIKETLKCLESIKALPNVKISPSAKTSQLINFEDVKTQMNRIVSERQALKEEIVKQRKKKTQDTELIEELEGKLARLTSIYNEIERTIFKAESDTIIEQKISNKIDEAFKSLQENATILENEKETIKYEYYISLCLIGILILLFFVFYSLFLCDFRSNREIFISWISFLPYTILIPIFVALIWMCVYFKDRSNKISIELSTRIFNIHYLEGLMKLTNSVASSHEESLRKLDEAAGSLMESYLQQIRNNNITENDVAKIELKELESNPYWKVISKLESIIKLIKK